MRKKLPRRKQMTDSLHNLIAAQGDAVIPNLRYADLAAPTASYVIDKRSTRVPFLAPIYSANNVSVARAIIADPGFLIPGSVYLSAEVHNTDATATHRLAPLTGLEGAFQRGRLLSGMVLEDVLEYARVGQIFHKLEPLTAQEEINKLGFGVVNDPELDLDANPGIAPKKKTPFITSGDYKTSLAQASFWPVESKSLDSHTIRAADFRIHLAGWRAMVRHQHAR